VFQTYNAKKRKLPMAMPLRPFSTVSLPSSFIDRRKENGSKAAKTSEAKSEVRITDV
jgi:hypothetical protein